MWYIRTLAAYLMSMNKINIDGVLIVEGKDDVCYLSNFVNALFFITNGYDLSEEKIEFLKVANKRNKLIVYTDPDEAGETIRNTIKSRINPVFEAKSQKIIRKNKKKFGVAELEKEEVLRSLEPFVSKTPLVRYNYGLASIISLSENPQETRSKIINQYRLIDGNNKFIENELNILKISHKELLELVNGN